MESRSAAGARRFEIGHIALTRIEPIQRSHDIFPRFENTTNLLAVAHDGRVENAVGIQPKQGIDVAGCVQAERFDPAEFAHVPPRFVGTVDPRADEFEFGVRDDSGDRGSSHSSGCPLDDLVSHVVLRVREEGCLGNGTESAARPQSVDFVGAESELGEDFIGVFAESGSRASDCRGGSVHPLGWAGLTHGAGRRVLAFRQDLVGQDLGMEMNIVPGQHGSTWNVFSVENLEPVGRRLCL